MSFQFATCDKNMAMRHLQKAYPNHVIDEEAVKEIMPYIVRDIVRIQDPDFHKPTQVTAGKNWSECSIKRKEITEAFKRFHDNLKSAP